jgi:DNA-binding NarL/FixJ family response regulator
MLNTLIDPPSRARSARVVIADDHALFRDGLKLLIECTPGLEVVGEASSLESLKPLVRDCEPDLLLIDYHMPGGDTSAVVAYLKQRHPALKIVAITGVQSASVLHQLVEVNADAVLLKAGSAAQLMDHLRLVLQGVRVIPPEVAALLQHSDNPLTRREFQILRMICDGFSSPAIADNLVLSVGTVNKHRENIQKKLNVNNVAQLIRKAQQAGWLDGP